MIVIMPYDIEASDLTAEVFRNGISLAQAEKKDGNLYLHIGKEAGVTLTDVLDIVITNNSDKNTAIVIVNHNTRKKQ